MAFPSAFPDVPASRVSPGRRTSHRLIASGDNNQEGLVDRAPDGINTLRRNWRLVWRRISRTSGEEVERFLRGRYGTQHFYWTPPGETVASLWVCPSEIDVAVNEGDTRTIRAEFEPYFGPAVTTP